MVLSGSQLDLLASTLRIHETNTEALAALFQKELPDRFSRLMGKDGLFRPLKMMKALNVQPCTWNMLLSRRCVPSQQNCDIAGVNSCPTCILETHL